LYKAGRVANSSKGPGSFGFFPSVSVLEYHLEIPNIRDTQTLEFKDSLFLKPGLGDVRQLARHFA
jgi:hypothetical protein